jgi:hypothetical protein
MDITQLILDDHHEQRRLFAIIEQIDPKDRMSLAAVWKRLATFLEVHAETEEKLFYPAMPLRPSKEKRREVPHGSRRWPPPTRRMATIWPKRSAKG